MGLIRPEFATQYALPLDCKVRAGVHDSSAYLYSYKLLNLEEFCVISTGTWLVAMAEGLDPSGLREPLGMKCNSDPYGNPICGALTIAGREYEAIAGAQPAGAIADPSLIQRLVLHRTMG